MFNDIIRLASYQLHLEETKFCVDAVQFIHHRGYPFVLLSHGLALRLTVKVQVSHIHNHLADEILVRQIFIIEVHVSCDIRLRINLVINECSTCRGGLS